jgi:EpsI family protein
MSVAWNRRNLLIGAACLAGAGAALGLKPRRHITLLGDRKLQDVIPRQFGTWTSKDVSDLVAPRDENSLAAKLYGQVVGRTYTDARTGFMVMMLAAYGQTQSRDLQLHRPEFCYPAVGFTIVKNSVGNTPLGHGAVLPTRKLVADAAERRETIVYWSRLGEYIPLDNMEQRLNVLQTQMSGYYADGLLMRVSSLGRDPAAIFPQLDSFIAAIVAATPMAMRPALVGHKLAQAVG